MAHQTRNGYTLLEVMIALALTTLTLGAIYSIYAQQVHGYVRGQQRLDVQQHARAAMDVLVREVRMAGYDPRHVNHDAVASNDFRGLTYDASRLVIKADLNGNGIPTDANESVVISHDAETSTLRRDTGGGRQPLAEHIHGFEVRYFDEQGQQTTESARIRQVEIRITAAVEQNAHAAAVAGDSNVTLRSRITPRNLRL